MLFTLAVTVFFGAILVFFSQEFVRLFKKIFSIPGVKLLLPLALASWLIEAYEDWGRWLLLRFQAASHQALHQLATLVPFEAGVISFMRIVYLFLLAGLPLWIYRLRAKQKGQPRSQFITDRLSLALWIVAAILLTVA